MMDICPIQLTLENDQFLWCLFFMSCKCIKYLLLLLYLALLILQQQQFLEFNLINNFNDFYCFSFNRFCIIPASNPAPPVGTTIASTSGTCSIISRPIVPFFDRFLLNIYFNWYRYQSSNNFNINSAPNFFYLIL